MADPIPLVDEQLDAFLTDGFVVLQPMLLTTADHDHLHHRAADLYETAEGTGNPKAHLEILGDNLRAQIPKLEKLLADPVIDGALTSLLGSDYVLHPHSYCHRSSERDQQFHQDGNLPWNERGHYRSHRPDWAMLFYYPQQVDETNGPTEVVPGSQYWTVDHEIEDGGWHPGDRIDRSIDDKLLTQGTEDQATEDGAGLARRDALLRRGLERGLGVPNLAGRFLHLHAGSAVLAHYDLIHRGSRTAGAPDPRFMYKFYFARVHRPQRSSPTAPVPTDTQIGSTPSAPIPDTQPTNTPIADREPTDTGQAHVIGPMVEANRRWLAGLVSDQADSDLQHRYPTRPEPAQPGRDRLVEDLQADREDLRIAAAYRLGRAADAGDRSALETLAAALHGPTEAGRRAAGLGLRQASWAGVPALLHGLGADSASVRRPAVAALATLAAAARPEAVQAVARAVGDDPDTLVRSNAAYSLGQMARLPEIDSATAADVLVGRLAPGAEPDNAFGAGFARSTVRQSAAYGLLQVLANHQLTDGQLEQITAGLCGEPDRYVQGLLVEGLARTERLGPAARRELVDFLAARRWNAGP